MAGPRIRIKVIKPIGAEFDTASLTRRLGRLVSDTTHDGVRFIAHYPSQQLTKSGYVRTGTLARSWSAKVRASSTRIEGTVGSSGNIAPYNVFVQGEKPVPIFPRAGWRGVDELDEFVQTRVDRGADAIIDQLTR